MKTFLVELRKRYTRSGLLFGEIPVRAESAAQALQIVEDAMDYKKRPNGDYDCLQTIDPRIKWQGKGRGDYVDFTFETTGYVEQACRNKPDEKVLLNGDDIRVKNRQKVITEFAAS
jgi:hypothetical protein